MRRPMNCLLMYNFIFLLAFILVNTGVVNKVGAEEKIVIGSIHAFSGGGAFYGIDMDRALKLGAEEINAQGGFRIKGQEYKIEVQSCDDEFKSDKGVLCARKLLSLYKPIMIFPGQSVTVLPILKFNEEENLLVMTESPDQNLLMQNNKLFALIQLPLQGMVRVLAEGAKKRFPEIATIAVIADSTEYSKKYAELFSEVWNNAGGKVLLKIYPNFRTEVNFYAHINKIISYNPDAIFVISPEEGRAAMIRQIREIGIKKPLLLNAYSEICTRLAGAENMENTVSIGRELEIESPRAIEYIDKYKKRWNSIPTSNGIFAYDSVYILVRTMEKAETATDVWKIRQTMPKVMPVKETIGQAYDLQPNGECKSVWYPLHFLKGKIQVIK